MHFVKLVALFAFILVGAACSRDPKVLRQKYLDSGNRYFNNGKYKEASIMYRRSLKEDMRFGEAYYRLGLADLKTGKITEALRAFQRAVELQPENTDAQAKVAEIFMMAYSQDAKKPQQFLNEVEEMTGKILALDPKSYDGLRLRAYLHLARKDLKAGIADLEAANSIKPDQTDLQFTLAQAYLANKQTQLAEKVAREGLEKQKSYGPFYDLLFVQYESSGRKAEAEEILKLKSSNNPKNVRFIVDLAAYYWTRNNRPASEAQLQRILANGTDFPNGRGVVGDFYYRVNDYERALAEYRKGASDSPKEKATYQKRMVPVLLAQGKTSEADAMVKELLKENPKDDTALAMNSAMALRTGSKEQIQQAVNDLQSVVSRNQQNHFLRFDYARALLAKGDIDQAKVQLQEAIKLRPDFVRARLALAQIFLSRGEFSSAVQVADQILQYDPRNTAAKLIRSGGMVGMKDYVHARQELNALLEQNPSLTDAQFQLGMVNLNEGKLKEAETEFRKLYTTTPKDPRGLAGTIETMLAQGKAADAMKLLEAEIRKAPDRIDLRRAYANAAVRSGNLDVGLKEMQTLLEKNPNDVPLMLRMGDVLTRKGDMQGAIKIVERAQSLAPNNATPALTLGMMWDQVGEGSKSRGLYQKVLSVEPDNPMALNNLAYLMAEEGTNLDEALTMAQKAKQKLPTNPEVSDTLGWIYIKKNLSDNAISIFRDLVSKHPGRSTFYYHLAMAYYQKGDKVEAKKQLQTALTKSPAKQEEEKIRELIAKCG